MGNSTAVAAKVVPDELHKPTSNVIDYIAGYPVYTNNLVTEEVYKKLADLYKSYVTNKLPTGSVTSKNIKAAIDKGYFSCISSKLPYPVHTDSMCQTYGVCTIAQKEAEAPQGIFANATVDILNSSPVMNDVNIYGASISLGDDKDNVVYTHGNGGVRMPATNSSEYRFMSLIVLSVFGLFILVCLVFTKFYTAHTRRLISVFR